MSVTRINNNLKNTDKKKGYVNGNDKNSNFTTCVSILTEGKDKEDIIQWAKEVKIVFNSKNQLLCSKNLISKMKKDLKNVVFGVLLLTDQKHRP